MGEIGEAGDAFAGTGGVLDDHGAGGVAGDGEERADAVEMATHLDDGGSRGVCQLGARYTSSAATGWVNAGERRTTRLSMFEPAMPRRNSKNCVERRTVYGMPDSWTSCSCSSLARK